MPQASDSSTFQLLLMNIESRDDVTRVGKKLGKIHCMSYDLRDVPIIFTQKLAGKVPTWFSLGTLQLTSSGTKAGDIGSSQ